MAAAWAWIRPELRIRWRTSAVLVLLVGVSTAVALTALAGARRTDTAFDRFLAASSAATHRVQYTTEDDIDDDVLQRLANDERVESAVPISFTVAFSEASEYDIGVFHSSDPRFLRDIDRPRLIEGRLPHAEAADEVVLSEFLSESVGAGIGDRIELVTFSQEQLDEEDFGEEPAGPLLDLEVVGIGRTPDDLADEENAIAYAGPGYYEHTTGKAGAFGPSLELRVRDGADVESVVADALAGVETTEAVEIEGVDIRSDRVGDATRVLVIGLRLFAACAGLAALVACGQAIGRRLAGLADDQAALQAMGFTNGQRFTGALLAAVPVVALGSVLGVALAIAASPLMPIGVARRAEPSPGIDIDLVTLGLGAALGALVLIAVATSSAWRATITQPGARSRMTETARLRRSTGAATAARAGWSPAAVLGIIFALEPGRGRSAVPVRPALVGAVVGMAGVAAALTFGSSLDRLVTTPAAYGWNWSISPDLFEGDEATLAALPELRDVGLIQFRQTSIEGQLIDGLAVVPVKGDPSLTVIEGHMPTNPGEVALGPKTLDRLDKRIGDRVSVQTAGAGDLEVTVVGEVLFPVFDQNPFNDGMAFHRDLAGDVELSDGFGAAIVGFADGIDEAEGVAAVRAVLPDSLSIYAYPTQPGDVANLAQVTAMPFALAAFLVIVALAAVGHALITSVRRRRHDIGIVRSVGFLRREVLASVAVQSSTIVLVGILVGVPLGVAIGRTAWGLVASELGVRSAPTVPLIALVLIVPAALLVANGIAMLPARAAARIRAADALRAE
jgi:ABC-type lipoprotein release transport system permease subunit